MGTALSDNLHRSKIEQDIAVVLSLYRKSILMLKKKGNSNVKAKTTSLNGYVEL